VLGAPSDTRTQIKSELLPPEAASSVPRHGGVWRRGRNVDLAWDRDEWVTFTFRTFYLHIRWDRVGPTAGCSCHSANLLATDRDLYFIYDPYTVDMSRDEDRMRQVERLIENELNRNAMYHNFPLKHWNLVTVYCRPHILLTACCPTVRNRDWTQVNFSDCGILNKIQRQIMYYYHSASRIHYKQLILRSMNDEKKT
jgi:hypothetical protein